MVVNYTNMYFSQSDSRLLGMYFIRFYQTKKLDPSRVRVSNVERANITTTGVNAIAHKYCIDEIYKVT